MLRSKKHRRIWIYDKVNKTWLAFVANMKRNIKIVGLFVLIGFLIVACGSDSPGPTPPEGPANENPLSYSLDVPNIGIVSYTILEENGGRVSWYRGIEAAHKKIVFDGKTQTWNTDSRTDIYVMNEDGSNKECITCDMLEFEELYQQILSQRQTAGDHRLGFWIGQPEWHPDGVHLIIQVENLNSLHVRQNYVSFGVDNDLWILNVETKSASRIWRTNLPRNAALHPRISDDGSKLIFSQRYLANLRNSWDGWGIVVADLDIDQPPENMITNPNRITPDGRGFYETASFLGNSNFEFSYSFTPFENGTVLPYVAEGRVTDVYGSYSQLVVDFKQCWDEKPRYSPTTLFAAVMSNAFDTSWVSTEGAATLETELYLGKPGSIFNRLTFFNNLDRYPDGALVTDHEWNQTGDKLIVQSTPNSPGMNTDIWLIELPQAY